MFDFRLSTLIFYNYYYSFGNHFVSFMSDSVISALLHSFSKFDWLFYYSFGSTGTNKSSEADISS